jgi:hypothetical protein
MVLRMHILPRTVNDDTVQHGVLCKLRFWSYVPVNLVTGIKESDVLDPVDP